MTTKELAFGGVMCALCSICIIASTLLHVIFPLAIVCVLYCLCYKKCKCSLFIIVIVTSNLLGFIVGGFGGGEIIFSLLLFSPYAMLICFTSFLDKYLWQRVVRAIIYAAFSFVIFVLFATVFKELVGMDDMGIGLYAFGALWTGVMTVFGFALGKVAETISKRFFKI